MKVDLLTIDMDSALRKLSLGRLRNADHVPLAIVRSFAGLNPSRIETRVNKTGFMVEHDGADYPAGTFDSVATVLDRARSVSLRQAALKRLESMGQLDILVAFCSGATKTTWYCPAQDKILVFENERVKIIPGAGNKLKRIQSLAPGKRYKQQVRELIRHLRFAPYEVIINGKKSSGGQILDDSIFQMGFKAGEVTGKIGIPRLGFAACTHMVLHGVIEREIWESAENGAVWEAVVHLDRGKEAMALAVVHDQQKKLMEAFKKALPSLAEEHKARAKEIFFRMADRVPTLSLLSGVAMFRTISGQKLTMEEVIRVARKNDGRLVAISKDTPAKRFIKTGDVFVLDEMDREFINKHLGIVIGEPQRKPRSSMLLHMFKPFRAVWLKSRALFADRFSVKIVKESELDEQERLLLWSLRQVIESGHWPEHMGQQVAIGKGGLLPWQWLDGKDSKVKTLVLKRNHPKVKKMVRSIGVRPEAILPIVMLLSEGDDLPDLYALAQQFK